MAFTSSNLSALDVSTENVARERKRRIKRRLTLYSFILPATLFLAIFTIYPVFTMASMSFEQVDLGGISTGITPFVGFQNYQQVLNDPVFRQSVVTSLIFTTASVVFQFIFGFLFALLFNLRFPGARILRGLVMMGWVIPIVVSSTIFKWMLQQDTGVVNFALVSLHIVRQPISWLTDPSIALISPVIANVWLGIPFYMALLLAGLQGISPTLYEAAHVDGTNALQRFRFVTLPLMRGPSLIVLTLGIIYTLNVFDLIYILTNGGPANATNVLPIYAYQQAFSFFNLGNGAAVTMLMFMFLLLVSVGYVFLIRREGASTS